MISIPKFGSHGSLYGSIVEGCSRFRPYGKSKGFNWERKTSALVLGGNCYYFLIGLYVLIFDGWKIKEYFFLKRKKKGQEGFNRSVDMPCKL